MTISRHMATAAALVIACTVAACGSAGDPSAAGAQPFTSGSFSPTAEPYGGMPDLTSLDGTDATAVSRTALSIMWTVDAVIDRGQRDAYLRAAPLLTTRYRAIIAGKESEGLLPSWQDHRAYAAVRLSPSKMEGDVNPDTARKAHRQWEIVVVPTGRDGWKGTPVHTTAFVTLTRESERDAWRVSAVSTA